MVRKCPNSKLDQKSEITMLKHKKLKNVKDVHYVSLSQLSVLFNTGEIYVRNAKKVVKLLPT